MLNNHLTVPKSKCSMYRKSTANPNLRRSMLKTSLQNLEIEDTILKMGLKKMNFLSHPKRTILGSNLTGDLCTIKSLQNRHHLHLHLLWFKRSLNLKMATRRTLSLSRSKGAKNQI